MQKSAVAAAVGLALSMHYQGAHALPEGGQVTAGQGGIGTPQNGSLVVTQQSSRVAIDWMKFGIGAGESVRFDQPGASAIALNRVIGNDASHIYGSLSANGQVFLLQKLLIKGDKLNKSITLPAYVPDVTKVQIWCAWAETNLGEASFERTVTTQQLAAVR